VAQLTQPRKLKDN